MIHYRAGYKYQLAKTYACKTPILGASVSAEFYDLHPDGLLVIKQGYAWDGASGPTLDTAASMRPSLVHDVFCQMMRAGELDYYRWQNDVNAFFKTQCMEDGMWAWRAALWHAAVEFANAGHPDQGESSPVLTAP
jgi:hypothetical protein